MKRPFCSQSPGFLYMPGLLPATQTTLPGSSSPLAMRHGLQPLATEGMDHNHQHIGIKLLTQEEQTEREGAYRAEVGFLGEGGF